MLRDNLSCLEWLGRAMVLGNIQCRRARHTHLDNSRAKIISEQGPIVLAVDAGRDGFDIFSLV